MEATMSDLRALAHLEEQLGEKCWQDLIDSANTGKIKQFLESFQSLLDSAGTITVRPAMDFVVSDFVQVNTKKDAPVKISYVGDNFKAWLLPLVSQSRAVPGDGPYRTPDAAETILRYYTMNKRSVDGPSSISSVAREAKAETTIAEIYALLKKQANGEVGALLNNGYANIFYVRDISSVLRAVYVFWSGRGWDVSAYSVAYSGEWDAGRRVFSR